MKNASFCKRVRCAFQGITVAFQGEQSFRTQSLATLAVYIGLIFIRPAPVWWAVITLTVASVLAMELVNTALEIVVDRLHPEQHSAIAKAKDCAAGAVLMLSLASLGIAIALVWDTYFK